MENQFDSTGGCADVPAGDEVEQPRASTGWEPTGTPWQSSEPDTAEIPPTAQIPATAPPAFEAPTTPWSPSATPSGEPRYGGQPYSGQEYSGYPYGAQPPYGGQPPNGGQSPYGGQAYEGQSPYGQPYGGQSPYGSQSPYGTGQQPFGTGQPPYGGQPYAGQPFAGAAGAAGAAGYAGQPPTAGQVPYWGPYGQEAFGFGAGLGEPDVATDGLATSGKPPKRGPRRLAAAGVAVVLLAGGVAGGVALGRSSSIKPQPTATQTIPGPAHTSGSSTTGKFSVSGVAAKVEPGVVDITSIIPSANEEAAGTGMILTSNGEVLTNNHVIANATKITAQIDGKGTKYPVKVLGADPTQDIALVQLVGASGLTTVKVGNSSSLTVGQPVVAIGNALDLAGPPTVTSGEISQLNRSIQAGDSGSAVTEHLTGLIQITAQIEPGNSGGPLANAAGQVIGVNTAAYSGSGTQAVKTIGFAIPINTALSVAQQIQQGHASSTVLLPHGFIGVEVLTIQQAEAGTAFQQFPTPAVSSGAYVAAPVPGDPAAKAGLTEGDVIIAVNSTPVATPAALGNALARTNAGQTVTLKWVDTSGTIHTSTITLVNGPLA